VIAALFVQKGGVYWNLPDVDPWDEERDARLYAGPWPVVAHPPCQRWGRYWYGGPSAKTRLVKGDDGGCFASALASVRRWGGVLEHPEASAAWTTFGLIAPPKDGGWVVADWVGGWTCCIEQGHYGHRARKATWLYAVGVELPVPRWGAARGKLRLEDGYASAGHRARAKANGTHRPAPRIAPSERIATPIPFRDLLLSIAASSRVSEVA
jgi:hypothetical protein